MPINVGQQRPAIAHDRHTLEGQNLRTIDRLRVGHRDGRSFG
jgi:hypothetical protein